MERRSFLKLLLGSGAGLIVAPEIPNVFRKYFFAPTGGWKGDLVWKQGYILTPELEFDTFLEKTLAAYVPMIQENILTSSTDFHQFAGTYFLEKTLAVYGAVKHGEVWFPIAVCDPPKASPKVWARK